MRNLSIVLLVLSGAVAHAQMRVDFTIDPASDNAPISPYIYGINWVHAGEELHPDWNLASRRLGGDRLSTYNWEINSSNSGNDCDDGCRNQNDDWLTYALPAGDQGTPGILPKRFHEDSKTLGCYSLVQLQGAGYVAGDRNEELGPLPPAPSSRWKEVRFAKGAPLSLAPDVNDGYVYIDEQVNYLVNAFGGASQGGVQGYSVDNEPGLWYSTHPRMRGLAYASAEAVNQAEESNPDLVKSAKATCTEVIDKSIAMAKAVKSVDPAAEIFGPAFWGFNDYYSLQGAPDWGTYENTYGIYLNMYLDKLRAAGEADGKRLLDVLDLHWYPQVEETPEKIMQCTRSLWDPGYKEDSWIANDVLGRPIDLLGTLKRSIDQYYPGTKLAFTEFRFGDADNGNTYYSGIAVADALGIFGKYGVYMAHYHQTDLDAPIAGYVAAAYKIFRNYDGAKSTFGSTSVRAATSDQASTAVYASVDPADRAKLHLIVINKSSAQGADGHFTIAGGESYTHARVWAFDDKGSAITERAPVAAIAGNSFSYTVPPLTVAHFVLEKSASGVEVTGHDGMGMALYQEVAGRAGAIVFVLPARAGGSLELFDPLGRRVAVLASGDLAAGEHRVALDARGMAGGVYFCRLRAGGEVKVIRVHVRR
jgi:mannan endo-1,4-beta-mannosidase